LVKAAGCGVFLRHTAAVYVGLAFILSEERCVMVNETQSLVVLYPDELRVKRPALEEQKIQRQKQPAGPANARTAQGLSH
jgi:hypothetical protein